MERRSFGERKMKIKRSCPSNKSWVEKKGVKNGGFCRVLPGKKRSISAPMGKAAPKMRQTALNLPSEPSTDYRGELLSVGITSAVLGALGGSVAAAMLLTPKGSGEAFRSGQQEAALNFEKEKAELESKYAGEIEKLKKTAGVNPKAQAEIDRLTKENESLKNQTPVSDPEMKNENDRLTQELAEKETIAKQSEEKLAALTQEHEELKRSSEKANADLQKVTEDFTKLQESSKTAAKPDPNLQKQLDEKSQEVSSLSAVAEERRVALANKESEHTQLQEQHEAIVKELEQRNAFISGFADQFPPPLSLEEINNLEWVQQSIEMGYRNVHIKNLVGRVEELSADKLTAKQIGKELGLDVEAVRSTRSKLNIPAPDQAGFGDWVEGFRAKQSVQQSAIAGLRSQQEEAATGFASSIREHQQTIDERNQTIAGLETTIETQTNAIKTHKETIDQLNEHINDLQSQHDQLLSVAQGSNVEELDKLVGTNYAYQRKQMAEQYSVAKEALSAAESRLKVMVDEHNQTLEEKDAIINAQKNQIQKYEKLQARTEGDLLQLHMSLENEVKMARVEAHQSASDSLKGKIKELEERLSELIGERDELLYGKTGLLTHLSGSGHRERYGGIQLAAAIRGGKVDLSDMSEAKFNEKVNYSTDLLLGSLESSSLSDNGSPVGTPFLLEWENNHNEILERFKSGDITPEELWKQQAIAHLQHINRRKEFLARMEDFKKTQRTEARKIASEFYNKYMAKKDKGEKTETVIKKYDAAFRAHYADMKKSVLEIQEEVKKQYPLGGFLNDQGEIDPGIAETALSVNFPKPYLAALLGNGKKKEVRGLNDRIRDMMGSNRSETEQGMTTTTTQEEVRGLSFDTVRFDDPEANKKAAEILEALEKAIDKKYGKLSYRNPDHREALNRRREEIDDLNNRYSSWLKDYARATSKVWNPGNPTEAEEKRMRQQMDLFKSQQMYESQLLRGEYKPDRKKKNRKK